MTKRDHGYCDLLRIIEDINRCTGDGASDDVLEVAFADIQEMRATAALFMLWERGEVLIKGLGEDGQVIYVNKKHGTHSVPLRPVRE